MTEAKTKLTAREIGPNAWQLAAVFGQSIGIDEAPQEMSTEFLNHLEKQTLEIFNEASNRDPMALMAQKHDFALAEKLRDGWRLGPLSAEDKTHPELLPFSQLPVEIRLKAQFFRTAVLLYLGVWIMH